jgi:hypothetical protein
LVDKRTIIEFLVKEGATSEEISEIMQIRCKEKKRIGNATGWTTFFFFFQIS